MVELRGAAAAFGEASTSGWYLAATWSVRYSKVVTTFKAPHCAANFL